MDAHEALVEKVAEAIMCARPNGGCEVKDWRREAQDNPHVAVAIDQARAAISVVAEALSKPTPEMVLAGDAAKIPELASVGCNTKSELAFRRVGPVLRDSLSVSPLYPKKDGGNG